MAEREEGAVIEVQGPGGTSAKMYGKRTSDLIAIFTMTLIVLVCYVLWMHLEESKRLMSELVQVSRDSVQAQRETTCIVAQPEAKREQEFSSPNSLCKRLTSEPFRTRQGFN